MSERFYDLHFERLESGTIRMEQSAFDEDSVIDAHPEQILFIARRLCGMKTDTAHQVAELERRLSVLAEKIQHIVCNEFWRSEILERLGDGAELIIRLDGLCDLAMEFDGGRLEPESQDDEPRPEMLPTSEKRAAPITKANGAGQLGLEV